MSGWPNPLETSPETIELAAEASTLPPSKAGAPSSAGPMRSNPPNSKLERMEKSGPMNEGELLKFDMNRPEENDDTEENRERSCRFDETRLEPNSRRGSRAYDELTRFRPTDDHPERFEAGLPFLAFPNERHCPSARALLP